MFLINKNKRIESIIPLIEKQYQVLHYDDLDILFSGMNKYDNRIIGSLTEIDKENKLLRYLHVICEHKDYIDFIKNNITYRNLIEKNKVVFIVDEDFDRIIKDIYEINYLEIPEEYLPLENSFCPEQEQKYSLSYVLRFKGNLADQQKAKVEDLTTVQLGFKNFIKKGFAIINDIKLNSTVYQEVLEPKSIRLGYNINFDKNLFTNEHDVARYITSFLEYTLLYLPDDNNILLDIDKTSKNYEILKEEVKRIYQLTTVNIPNNIDEKIKNELVESISDVENISNQLGDSFNEIEIYRSDKKGDEPFGYINFEYKNKINKTAESIAIKKGLLTEDQVIQEYEIIIYHLNKLTRTGNAEIFSDKEKTIISKPRIWILGDDDLTATKYTESLHFKKRIKVSGKAKRIKDNISYLTIEFEK